MIASVLIQLVTIASVFILMEGVAWFLHKYFMHGIGWYVHEDHHRPSKGRFEKNDAFGLFFAAISFLIILTGVLSGFDLKLAVGLGIMLYGIGYLMVHDILFHKRIEIQYRPKNSYIKRILHAHGVHHQASTSNSGICFGFLYASKKYSVSKQPARATENLPSTRASLAASQWSIGTKALDTSGLIVCAACEVYLWAG